MFGTQTISLRRLFDGRDSYVMGKDAGKVARPKVTWFGSLWAGGEDCDG